MVQFVDVENLVNLVAEFGLEPLLLELARYIEDDFRRWPDFEKRPRIASLSPVGAIELMPTSNGELYAFKYVNGHPGNVAHGLQTVAAFGMLADVRTGYPLLLSELTVTTAMRTAATSALAAKYLARSDSETMAIIGLGAQSEFQALAFRALLGVRSLRVFDVDPDAEEKFVRNLGKLGLSIVRCRDAGEAVHGADIITTATADKRRATVISDSMVEAGVHINAVGGDCPGKTELPRELIGRADVFVEFAPQTRIEGEIQQMEAGFPVTELWRVIVGDAPGRCGSDRITLFDSVGFAIEDFSALRFLRDKVRGTRHFSTIDLLPAPRDPRDLFGVVAGGEIARGALKDPSPPRAA